MRIAIDTGGTFTDCVYAQGEELRVLKAPSTPTNPGEAVLNAVLQIVGNDGAEVRHGTTVGTNALLERKGARVAFVTTAGFEDTIEIGRQARPKLYDLFVKKEPPLAPSELRFGVIERTAATGELLKCVSAVELTSLTERVSEAKPESIAISLLFGFANPTNESAVAEALAAIGVPVSVAHEILPEFREYERGSTVLVNAYLAPKMQSYLQGLNSGLEKRGSKLFVMQSSGGIVQAALAAKEAVRTILSGPAGGVVGATKVARAAGHSNILTFDMGGTSTDVALVTGDGALRTSTEFQIMGMPVAIPMLDIHTVGAGGGSLASFDRGGALKVGPQSAGADPGPVCYGLGDQPTVTDANLILGRIDADGFLNGGMRLNQERARQFLNAAKRQIDTVEKFAEGILRLADSHIVQALRKISVEQGHDPREFVLVSFGGAGPLHACALAKALRIPKVIVPRFPGALSAYGILVSDVIRDFSRTVMLRPDDPRLDQYFNTLEEQIDPAATLIRSVDMRYAGQGFELAVPWERNFVARFHEFHRRRYGYADDQRSVEIVNVRVRSVISSGDTQQRRFERLNETAAKPKKMYIDGKWVNGLIYHRDSLGVGDILRAPAVVTEYSATTFLPPGVDAQVDHFGNLVIHV